MPPMIFMIPTRLERVVLALCTRYLWRLSLALSTNWFSSSLFKFSSDITLDYLVVDQARLKGGKHAAVKVLSATSSQGVAEFLTEIRVISEIEHENLVKLYGCCVEDDHRILVYNYLENNSLAHTLLGNNISFKPMSLCTFFLGNKPYNNFPFSSI